LPIYLKSKFKEQMMRNVVKQVKEYAAKEHAEVIPLCVKIEEELSGLDDSE